MKILLVSPIPPPAGGIATWTRNILSFVKETNYHHQIIHQNTSYNLKEITRVDILSRIRYGLKELRLITRELRENILNHHPEVIHLTSSASLALIKDYLIIRLARKHGIPVVIHWRFGRIPDLAKTGNWEWKMLGRVIRSGSISIVIDSRSYDTLIKAGFRNILRIPNPLGIGNMERISLQLRAGERKSGSVVFIGHLIRAKGVYELVEACSLLSCVTDLTLVGHYDQKVKEELLSLAAGRGNGIWLNIAGESEADLVHRLMLESELLALPSYTEGFPNVVLEAMALGCTVVATDVGAIPEMLDASSDLPCGLCVPARDAEQLTKALRSLLEDPERCRLMGENGKRQVRERYTMEKVMLQYESAWEKAVIEEQLSE